MAGDIMDGNGERPAKGWLDPSRQEVALRVMNTDMRGWVLTIPEGTSVLGREPDCKIHLPHYTISRRHCSFQVMPDSIEVRDLNSMNGTMVNGSLAIEAVVGPGDQLRVGEVELAVEVRDRVTGKGPIPAAPPPPPEPVAPVAVAAVAPSNAPLPPPPIPRAAVGPPPAPPILPAPIGVVGVPQQAIRPVPPLPVQVAARVPVAPPAIPAPPRPAPAPVGALQPSQYSYQFPTPSWAVRPHVETVRYREAKRTMRFDPARRDAFRQFSGGRQGTGKL